LERKTVTAAYPSRNQRNGCGRCGTKAQNSNDGKTQEHFYALHRSWN